MTLNVSDHDRDHRHTEMIYETCVIDPSTCDMC